MPCPCAMGGKTGPNTTPFKVGTGTGIVAALVRQRAGSLLLVSGSLSPLSARLSYQSTTPVQTHSESSTEHVNANRQCF
jgi:hypothetical protein